MTERRQYLMCLAVVLSVQSAYAASADPDVEEWAEVVDDNTQRRWDRLGEKVSDVVFEGINDIKIFSERDDNFGIDLSVHRRVFDNRDIMNSWTVVDRFDMGGNIPIFTEALSSAGSVSNIGFSIGADFGIDFMNIRQVMPRDYEELPSVDERRREITESSWYKDFVDSNNGSRDKKDKVGEWVYSTDELGENKLSFIPFPTDPESDARYGRFWNLVLFPFRLPLTANAVSRMSDGEIISFVGRGSIQFGANVGWELDPSGLSGLINAGVNYSAYVGGNYRISVLRESERYVKVKVTRAYGVGHSGSIGGGYKPGIFDGVIVLKDLSRQLKVIPFQVSVSRSLWNSFDVGYRYDLVNTAGREAYEQAVSGRLALSDELSVTLDGQPRDFEETGVQKVFSRSSRTDTIGRANQMRLGFVFRRESNGSLRQVDSTIGLPDGTHHVYSSMAENSKNWRLFWGVYEKFDQMFMINLDMDRYAADPNASDALTFVSEGRIEDSDTDRNEMIDYILQLEDSIGKYGIFPRPPQNKTVEVRVNPDDPSVKGFWPGGNFGKSKFFYRVAADQAQVEKFMNTPENEMWEMLEKVFKVPSGSWANVLSRFWYGLARSPLTLLNIPLYFADVNLREGSELYHAARIKKLWQSISKKENVREKAEAMGKMFYDRIYGYELAHLFRTRLDGEKIAYITTGYNTSTFGRIYDQGESEMRFENVASRAEREIGFDNPGARPPAGDGILNNYQISRLDEFRYEVSYSLEKKPYALFFQLLLDDPWWSFKNKKLAQILINNAGNIVEGANSFVLDSRDQSSPWYPIAQHLKTGERYLLRASANNDRLHWGPVAEENFRVK